MRIIVIAFILLMEATHSFALQNLTLSQCITLAFNNNLQLHNTRSALQTLTYSQREHAAAAHPQIKLLGTVYYAPHTNRFGYDPISTDGGLVNAMISIKQPLNSRRFNRLQSKLSDIDQHSLTLQLAKAERDLSLFVKKQFIETLRGQSEIKLRSESVERLSEYLSIVQLQYAGGTSEYSSVIKIKTMLSVGQEALLKAQLNAAISKLSLASLISTTMDTSFELCGNIDTMVSEVECAEFTIDTVGNPDIITMQDELNSGIAEFDLLKRSKYPVISFTIDGGYLSSFDRLTSNESKTTFGFSLGTNVEIPLIDWGVLRYQKLRQQMIADTLRTAAAIGMQSLRSEYRTLQLKIYNNLSLLTSIRNRVKYAEEDYLLTKSKHTTGASSSADLLLAQQAFSDALLDELQTKADILTFAYTLEELSDHQRK